MRELMVPPDAKTAGQAVELLRGWIIDGHPHYVLFPTLWKDDLGSWGRFLADTAQHLADALSKDTGRDRQQILREILESFLRELTEEDERVREGGFRQRSDADN
jgi:predicted DNA-binding protein